jgi:hypothetical protein
LGLSFPKIFNFYFAAFLPIAAVTIFYLIGQTAPYVLSLTGNPLLLTLFAAAFTSATFTARKYGWSFRGRIPQIWMLICYAAAFFLATQLGKTLHPYITGVGLPYPFFADFFFLVSYLLIAAALTLYVGTFGLALNRESLVLLLTTAAVSGFLVSYSIVLPVLLLGFEGSIYIFDLTLTVANLIVFILALTGLTIFLEGRLEKAWLFLTLAAVCLTLYHFMVSYINLIGVKEIAYLVNLPAAWGIILLTIAFYMHRRDF